MLHPRAAPAARSPRNLGAEPPTADAPGEEGGAGRSKGRGTPGQCPGAQGTSLAGWHRFRPVVGVGVSAKDQRLLFRRRFIGVLSVSPTTHRQPRRVHPVVGTLVVAVVIPPVDRVEPGVLRRGNRASAGLMIRNTQLEARVFESWLVVFCPQSPASAGVAGRVMVLYVLLMSWRVNCKRGQDCEQDLLDSSLASCSG
jgi:hypothetical protein